MGVLLYGPLGTGNTLLLAKPISYNVEAIFLKVQLLSLCCVKKVLDEGVLIKQNTSFLLFMIGAFGNRGT